MLIKRNAVVEMPADAGSAAGGGALEYAGFWMRVAALLVDSAIVTVVGVLLLIVLGMAMGGAGVAIGNIVFVLLQLLYWPVMESSARQATFGKQLLGIEVTDLAGNRTSFIKSLLRNLAKIISSIPFGIGFLLAAFTGRKQALHDMITGCLVVRSGPSSLLKAVAAVIGGLVIVSAAGGYYATQILPGQLMGGMEKEMDRAMKDAQKDMQRQMEQAMKEASKAPPRPAPPAPAATPPAPKPPAATPPAAQEPVVVAASPAPAKPAAPVVQEVAVKPASEVAPSAADKPKAKRRVATRKPAAPAAGAMPAAAARTPKYNDVMSAVMFRDRAGAAEALELGLGADRADSNGVTPLMAAAINGDAAIAQLLLQHGADPNRRGPAGSVLEYAMRGRDSKVIALLKKAGAR